MVQSKYFIETTPIRVVELPRGGKKTEMNTMDLRVVDSYTRMPVGVVIHSPNASDKAEYLAKYFFDEGGNFDINSPAEGWGIRFDRAADAVWRAYSKDLPWHERIKRWFWRWLGVGWFLFGTVWGVLTSFLVKAITGAV
ncbi:MAG: hypothetical protein OXH31_02940 [Gammaproteobacteria bacterium]|nr:hypothetical protein [Gammaproteobacteria bacterium]